jgi:hypothetical protein
MAESTAPRNEILTGDVSGIAGIRGTLFVRIRLESEVELPDQENNAGKVLKPSRVAKLLVEVQLASHTVIKMINAQKVPNCSNLLLKRQTQFKFTS